MNTIEDLRPEIGPLDPEWSASRSSRVEPNDAGRAAVESHAASCAECARCWPICGSCAWMRPRCRRVSGRDLWAVIAANRDAVVESRLRAGSIAGPAAASAAWNRVWMGLAAAGLVAVTATVTHQLTKRSVSAAATPVAVTAPKSDTPVAATLVSNPPTPEQKVYDAEIARLRGIVAQRRSMLDTATVSVIDHNLKIIDGAIDNAARRSSRIRRAAS